jgi:hypothetical protein
MAVGLWCPLNVSVVRLKWLRRLLLLLLMLLLLGGQHSQHILQAEGVI